ncbi:O-acetyl-ADP-ribose deacetylase [Tepidimicrobium xylanilyticum]|uniref:O-acetyl-ADP-ribose deacetylase (Regulator of RNase III), contains Macro domain n=1 Tax=Tepidimicrobium xylanilyticum TaxID=1123352 RepID=A0A1H3DS65_9FIRM|nr:O-acetyl-ADP-ribose deacetylase [Tepidimicrobium xylanilyticum]SDX69211.1 O-acetyl-ADP-ribose deacetylase (regulator of RNase III), contains Macro domain [Tepidimicrobium xylanilyticum]
MYIYNKTKINIIQGDITKMEVDAIVNAANNTLLGGGGVDGAIHRAGGPTILEQCKKIGGCPTGEARITTAGNMPSRYVIHTVGPVYRDGTSGEEKLLYNAYYNSLKLAKEYNLKTIAFPAISTGVYNYPKLDAAEVATRAVMDFIAKENFIEEVYFVLFNQDNYQIYKEILDKKLNG